MVWENSKTGERTWYGLKSNNTLALTDPDKEPVNVYPSIEKAMESSTSPKEFRRILSELTRDLERSGEVDAVAMRKFFAEWPGMDKFTESDDIYLNIIDQFMKLSGGFEANKVTGAVFDEKKIDLMKKSIELQRTVIGEITSCVNLDESGELNIVDEVKYEKMLSTFEFMENFSSNIMQSGDRRSRDSNLIPFLSGIRSMICASLLIRSAGSKVDFLDVEYDLNYDLDFVAVDRSGRRHAMDVTTYKDIEGKTPPKLLFSYFKNDTHSRIPHEVIKKENLYRTSKLIVPNAVKHPGFFSNARGARTIGIPGPYYVKTFTNMFQR